MATSMEQMQQGERFTMLDPPNLAGDPGFPQSPQVLRNGHRRRISDWVFVVVGGIRIYGRSPA